MKIQVDAEVYAAIQTYKRAGETDLVALKRLLAEGAGGAADDKTYLVEWRHADATKWLACGTFNSNATAEDDLIRFAWGYMQKWRPDVVDGDLRVGEIGPKIITQ